MDITVNGRLVRVDGSTTVGQLITQYELSPKTVIVELRGDLLAKEAYDATRLEAGDTVELIQFVGGG